MIGRVAGLPAAILLSMLLWLVIVTCVVLALGNPVITAGRVQPQSIAVILDNSASMQARMARAAWRPSVECSAAGVARTPPIAAIFSIARSVYLRVSGWPCA